MSEQEKRAGVEAATKGLNENQQALLMAFANGLKAGVESARAAAQEPQETADDEKGVSA